MQCSVHANANGTFLLAAASLYKQLTFTLKEASQRKYNVLSSLNTNRY